MYRRRTSPYLLFPFWIVGLLLLGLVLFMSLPTALSDAQLPVADSLALRGYIRPNGTVVVEETVTFSRPIPASTFLWHLPKAIKNRPDISINGGEPIPGHIVSTTTSNQVLGIKSSQIGHTFRITYSLASTLIADGDDAVFRWQLVSQPVAQIRELRATLALPYPISQELTTARVFGTNNIGTSAVQFIDDQTISVTIRAIDRQALAAFYLKWPKVGLRTTITQRIINELSAANLTGLFVSTIALPVLVLTVLVLMILKHMVTERIPRIREERETPPEHLPPALVGTLIRKQLSHDALLATIFDLSQRGYIDMIEKGRHYSFGRHKTADTNVHLWERGLLEQLFQAEELKIEHGKLERRAKARLFSPQIVLIYESVYERITAMGYFKQNPHLIIIQYKLVGLICYFFGIASFIFLIATNQPFVMLIPAMSVFLSTFIIIRFARFMPERSPEGKAALAEWLRFRNYLANPQPLNPASSAGNLFFAYLPYAIVLGVEKQWAFRFRKQAISEPLWFVSYQGNSTESFTEKFVATVDHVSKTFVTLHGPIVE